jgi:integrase/recombinase XerD
LQFASFRVTLLQIKRLRDHVCIDGRAGGSDTRLESAWGSCKRLPCCIKQKEFPYSMQHALDAFFVHLSADGATPASTLSAYRSDLLQWITYLADRGITDLKALQPDHMQDFCAWLEAQGYATATIARRIVSLRAFSAFLCATGQLPDDLCAKLRPPVVARRVRSAVAPEQIAALRAFMLRDSSADGWRDRAILEVLLATALRVSDIVALDLGDVAVEAATLTVRGRKPRTLALTPEALMALVAYLQLARPKLLRESASEPALFLNRQGERLTRQGCWVVLKQHARQLGLDGITPEALRQSVAAQHFAEGATVDQVQALLGHAVRKTTAAYRLPAAPDAKNADSAAPVI